MAKAYFDSKAKNCKQACYADSAGIAAFTGFPASRCAIEVMDELYHIDLSEHQAKPVSPELIDHSDLVLGMTEMHKKVLQKAYPDDTDKIFTLTEYARILSPDRQDEWPFEIRDPYGNMLSAYKEVIRQIAVLVDILIEHLCKI